MTHKQEQKTKELYRNKPGPGNYRDIRRSFGVKPPMSHTTALDARTMDAHIGAQLSKRK